MPVSLAGAALKACHSHVMCGHLGTNSTLTKFKERFFVPHLRSFVLQKLQSCLPCLKKNKAYPALVHQQHHEYTSYFGQKLCIDTVGPLNRTMYKKRSVCHILTMQDSFTRYLVTVPVEDLEAKTIAAEVMEHWILKFGIPEQIHTDRGVSFTSQLFMEVMNMMGIRKTVTPPYCPRGDRVERAHQVLGEILRSDERGPDVDWARKLPEATLAYNIATNRVTGVSPYEAVFGQKAVLPVDFLFPCHKSRETTMARAIDTRRSQMNQLVQRMLNLEQRTIQLDSRYRPKEVKNPLKVGDTVYMFVTRLTPQVSAKLQSRWTGPWAVSQIASLSLVELSPIGSWSKSKRTVTTTVDRVHVFDLESLDHHDLHPADPVDVDAEGIILGDEDEGEIVIPSRGFYDTPSPGDDVTETLPGMAIKQEVQDEVCTDLYDDYEPEVVIPEGIPVTHLLLVETLMSLSLRTTSKYETSFMMKQRSQPIHLQLNPTRAPHQMIWTHLSPNV